MHSPDVRSLLLLSALWLATVTFTFGQTEATLKVATSFPLCIDGKQVGSTTVAAGTKVKILQVSDGRILAAYGSTAQAWIPSETVQMASTPEVASEPAKEAPAETAVPSPAKGFLAGIAEAASKVGGALNELKDEFTTERVAADTEPPPSASSPSPPPSETPQAQSSPPESDGNPLEALIELALSPDWEDQAALRREIKSFDIPDSGQERPAEVLTRLSGRPMKNGAQKGTLRIEILSESDHSANPGLAAAELDALKAYLATPGHLAVVQLMRRDWRVDKQSGAFEPETALSKNSSPRIALLTGYDPATDSFFCQTGNRSRILRARLDASDLKIAAVASATADVSWLPPSGTEGGSSFLEGFTFKETYIQPGQCAFLALPFEEQARGGICTAASALNVIKFIDPGIELEQRELFALYNGERSGASLTQVLGGLESMGFEAEMIQTAKADRKELVGKIHASLDAKRPVLITIPGHALTMIGYDKPNKKLIAWDQRMSGPGRPENLPRGGYETSETSLSTRFDYVCLIRKVESHPSNQEELLLQEILGPGTTAGILRHEIVNGNSRKESLAQFLRHAAPPKLKAILRRDRTILLPKGKKEIVAVTSEVDGKWNTKLFPSGNEDTCSDMTLARILDESGGVFYSRPNQRP